MRVRAGWAIALLLIAALGFTASYRGVLVLVVVPAVAVPFGLVALGRKLTLGTNLAGLVSIVLGAGVAWLVLRAADTTPGDAIPRLLTTPRPAPATAALLTPPALLALLVATLVAVVVLSDTTSRAGLLVPVAGAAVLYTVASLLSAGDSDPYGIAAAGLLVVTVGGWSHPYLRGGGRVAWRPVAAVPLVVAGALALATGTLVSAGAFDPREHVTPPTVRLNEASPLTQLRSWTANPDVRILRARVTGTDRLQLATLDTFTGAAWEVDSSYQQLGLVASTSLPRATRSAPVRATVSIERLGGVWLPGAGAPQTSSLDDLLVDPDDGTLARPGRITPGLTYDLTARRDDPTQQQLAAAAVPTRVPAQYLALPDAPVAFAEYARAAVRGASTPLEEAIALENAVATDRRLDPTAPSGSSYGRLSTFLFAKAGTAGAGVGTAEQFAAAFAVLARQVGLPTRLTVGFELPDTKGNTVTVRGRDATVWPEVYLGGAGWVAFAPTPGADGSGPGGTLRDDVLQRLSERADQAPPVTPPVSATPTTGPRATPVASGDTARPADGGLPGWALALVVVGGVLVLTLLALATLRGLRTRRHRSRGARGAWAELVDLLVLVGRRPSPDRPAPQIADDADDLFGEPAAVIAAAADREAFAPSAATSAPVWGHVRVLRRQARRTLPRYRRMLLPVDPRPLVSRRR